MNKVEEAFILYIRAQDGHTEAIEQLNELMPEMSEYEKKELKDLVGFEQIARKSL